MLYTFLKLSATHGDALPRAQVTAQNAAGSIAAIYETPWRKNVKRDLLAFARRQHR